MKYRAGLLAVLMGCPLSAATAQTAMITQFTQPSAFGVDPLIRVVASFRVAIASSDGQAASSMTAQEAARREIYAMAAKECGMLSETFKAECRLGSINTFAPGSPPSPPSAASASMSYLNATANYELKPR
jgi:hypothetical protein